MAEDLRAWIGRREETTDVITAWPVRALQATLDLPDPEPQNGDPLPPLWHWLFFLPTAAHSDLGSEGHALPGGFLPPVPLPRRMFAGGRFTFHRPLRIGEPATRTGTVRSVEEKHGKTGQLLFVTVRYEFTTDEGLCIAEEQDLVYREAPHGTQAPAPGIKPVPTAPWTHVVEPDPVMLFRFSALTFNGHRIHYDHPYVTEVEGYPDLIVHGPMTALLLADLARRNGSGPIRTFAFRARAPLFTNGPFTVLGGPEEHRRADLSVWSHDQRLAVTAQAEF
ncbi:MAG: acyl-CoA dehydrogenase [Acidimicrobiia bacterium]|nr:acyl-CoA dehydrogenase [Acidimicrobiia bacterium]